MKLSFNTWVYSSFPVWVPSYPLDETIRRLARIGYDGIEIGAAAPHAYPDYIDADRRQEIKAVLDANGIACSSMLPAPGGGPGFNVSSPLEAERANAIDQYVKVARLCADLGGKTLLYVAGWQVFGTTTDQAWEWSREALRTIAAKAADMGVTVAIEPTSMDSNLVESCDDAIRMMREVGAPNVKLMFDTIHVLYRSEVPTDYAYRMGADLHHIHLSDTNRNAPSASGKVDYEALVAALKEIDFKGYVTMEIGFNRRDVDPDYVARSAYEYLKPLVG
ncbi:protein FrlC [Rhodobium orientis]|uniref:Sugar phosphate isomerase n=1 Tax=Rhodobium orientis TaxID=34017 RepID=A0A327JNI5_9HYPH|nr:sugar phosphate isomerase/epimerase family protein [Rhodobium orientis]MBB4301409.1 protein FrlC [Rhodobium orientis]MBK5951003.1 sugar phosphate isomerase [Rhodobium orientis]RAI27631.1 sugar phosphate isomerase [Rhodobium orientis]